MPRKRRFCDLDSDQDSDEAETVEIKRRRISNRNNNHNNNHNNNNNNNNNNIINKKLYYTQIYQEYINSKESESKKKLLSQSSNALQERKKTENLLHGFGFSDNVLWEFIKNKKEKEKRQRLERERNKKEHEKLERTLLQCCHLLISSMYPQIEVNNDLFEDSDDNDDDDEDIKQWIDDIPDIPRNKNVSDYESMKVSELKDLCKSIGFQVSGKKCILIGRLLNPSTAIREKKYAHFMKSPRGGRPQTFDTNKDILNKITFNENKLVWKKGGVIKYKPID